MKRFILFAVILISIFTLIACIKAGTVFGEVEFKIDLGVPVSEGYNINRVHVTLEHQKTHVVVEKDLEINPDGTSAFGTIKKLRIGKWDLLLQLFEDDTEIGRGSTVVNIKADVIEDIYVKIKLATGGVNIYVVWDDEEEGCQELAEIIETIDPGYPSSLHNVEELLDYMPECLEGFLDLLKEGTPLERWAAAYVMQRSELSTETLDILEYYLDDDSETIAMLIGIAFLVNGDDRGKATLESLVGSTEIQSFMHPPQTIGEFVEVILHEYYPGEYSAPFDSYEPQTTSVTGGPCDFEVTVKVAFHGEGASSTQVDNWEAEAKAIWNGSEGRREWGCCTVSFDFDFSVLDGTSTPTDAHIVKVKKVRAKHISYVNTPLPTPGSSETTTAVFDSLDTPKVIAHELGHLMGLDDEYSYDASDNYVNDNPQPKDPQSIMAQTWGKVAPLPSHINKMMTDAGKECECNYKGSIDPGYDVNLSPGIHTVVGTFRDADNNPLKEEKIEVTVTGLHPYGPEIYLTDDSGMIEFTYECTEEGHTGEDVITMEGTCNAIAVAFKDWISLDELLPEIIIPADEARKIPHTDPLEIEIGGIDEEIVSMELVGLKLKVIKKEEPEIPFFEDFIYDLYCEGPIPESGTDYELTVTVIEIETNTYGNSTTSGFSTTVPEPDYEEMPCNMKADISTADIGVRSHIFAEWIEKYIVAKGYKRMTFIFGQCYGGGMFKDLKDFDNTFLKSAARWDERAWAAVYKDSPHLDHKRWLKPLREAIEAGKNIAVADEYAYKNNIAGLVASPATRPATMIEHPQGLYNGDPYYKLTDDASSKHALIFSGSTEVRNYNDSTAWENTLSSTPFNFDSVTTIVGGTAKQMETALASIGALMNENEEFVFIGLGHGSDGQRLWDGIGVPMEGIALAFVAAEELEYVLDRCELGYLYLTADIPRIEDWRPVLNFTLNEVYLGQNPMDFERAEFYISRDPDDPDYVPIYWGGENELLIMPGEGPVIDGMDYIIPETITVNEIFLDTGPVAAVEE